MMEKIAELTQILKRLDSGENPVTVKEQAKEFLSTIDVRDLSIAEQNLLDEGLSVKELQELCPIHLELIGDQVGKLKSMLPDGHALEVLVREHEAIMQFLEELEHINQAIQKMLVYDGDRREFGRLNHIARQLVATEAHHQREEEIMFPALEERGFYGPPAVLTRDHMQFKQHKHELRNLADQSGKMNFGEFKEQLDSIVRFLVPMLRAHIFKENNILYPTALKVIDSEDVWLRLKARCDETGYCCFDPPK